VHFTADKNKPSRYPLVDG